MTKKAKILFTSITVATVASTATAIAINANNNEVKTENIVSASANSVYKATTATPAASGTSTGASTGTTMQTLVFVYNQAKRKFEDARQVIMSGTTDIDAITKAVLDMEEQMNLLEKYNVTIKERNAIADPTDPVVITQINKAVRNIRTALDGLRYVKLDKKATLPLWAVQKHIVDKELTIDGVIRQIVKNLDSSYPDAHQLYKHEYLIPKLQQLVDDYNKAVRFANSTAPEITQKAKDQVNIIIITFSLLAAMSLAGVAFLTFRKMLARK